MANVLVSKLIRWCSLLPFGIAACIGSIHLTNVSKPIATLDALELEKVPELEEEEIIPEEKPEEKKDQPQEQQQQQQQEPPQAAAASSDDTKGEEDQSTDQKQTDDSTPESSSDVQADQSAAVVGGAVATGADEPIEVIRRGLLGIARMNTSEGRVKELVSISSLLNTVNQLTTAAKQIQLDKKGTLSTSTPAANPSAPAGATGQSGTPAAS